MCFDQDSVNKWSFVGCSVYGREMLKKFCSLYPPQFASTYSRFTFVYLNANIFSYSCVCNFNIFCCSKFKENSEVALWDTRFKFEEGSVTIKNPISKRFSLRTAFTFFLTAYDPHKIYNDIFSLLHKSLDWSDVNSLKSCADTIKLHSVLKKKTSERTTTSLMKLGCWVKKKVGRGEQITNSPTV